MTPEYLKKSKRALGIDMQMKIRTPHQNQTHWKRTHHLPEFLFFPQGQSVFQKGKRKESLKKKKKTLQFQSLFKLRQNDSHSLSQVCEKVIFCLINFHRMRSFSEAGGKIPFRQGWEGNELSPKLPLLLATLRVSGVPRTGPAEPRRRPAPKPPGETLYGRTGNLLLIPCHCWSVSPTVTIDWNQKSWFLGGCYIAKNMKKLDVVSCLHRGQIAVEEAGNQFWFQLY